MTFATLIHVSQRINCESLGIPSLFSFPHLYHHQIKFLNLSNTLAFDKIPAKLMTFPSTLAIEHGKH